MIAVQSNPNWIRTATVAAVASLALHGLLLYTASRVRPDVSVAAGRWAREAGSVLVLPPDRALPPPRESVKPPEPPPPIPPPTPPPPAPTPLTAPGVKPPAELVVLPGIDDSTATTKAWLGFAQETPHQLNPGMVDQSALSPSPGLPVPPSESGAAGEASARPAPPVEQPPAPDAPPPAPSEGPHAGPSDTSTTAAPSAPASPQQPVPTPKLADPASSDPRQPRQEVPPVTGDVARDGPDTSKRADDRDRPGKDGPALPAGATESARRQQREQRAAPPQRETESPPAGAETSAVSPGTAPAAAPTPATPPANPPAPSAAARAADQSAPTRDRVQPSASPGAQVAGDRPALRSDAEADGTSIDRALAYKFVPGQVLARKGLRIFTTRPQFSLTTQVLGLARNTYVKIRFKRDGRVKDADFVDGAGTGNESVDGPLKFALYNWTAKGVDLDRLPPGNPDATVSMVIKVLFREDVEDSADNDQPDPPRADKPTGERGIRR